MPKILILDIETAPNVAYVWRFFKENVSPKQVKEHSWIMSHSYKWLGEDHVRWNSAESTMKSGGDDKELIQDLVELLDQADIVVAHNAKRFDIPSILGRALVHGIKPPSPFKVIDTLVTAKQEFKFPSNSLEYLALVLDCEHKKGKHSKFPGFELWVECLKGNHEAWKELIDYNILDVLVLEDVYLKMRPFMRNHPNLGVLLEEDGHVCPKCGSKDMRRRGFATTNVGKYQRFRCNDCGGWSRSRYTEYPKEKRHSLLVNAVQ